jgi:hypothetical protein
MNNSTLNDWQPAILKPVNEITCELHKKALEALPSDVIEGRNKRVGRPLKIRPIKGVYFEHNFELIPNGECYSVMIKDENGLTAGGFSCEFLTD